MERARCRIEGCNKEVVSRFRTSWSEVLKADEVSKLLMLQWLWRMGLAPYSPLDDVRFVAGLGEEGSELNGVVSREGEKASIRRKLGECEIIKIEVRLMDRWERAVVHDLARLCDKYERRRLAQRVEAIHMRKQANSVHARYNRKRYAARKARLQAAGAVIGTKKEPMKKSKSEPKKEEERVRHFEPEERGGQEEAISGSSDLTKERKEQIEVPLDVPIETVIVDPDRVIKGKIVERPVVELEVMRVGPNPRTVSCGYKVLADERRVTIKVKTNRNFKRGMKWKLVEQEGSEWSYEGALPRRLGVW
ncbi:MAG TPA: hypothetical protein VFO40_15615 [Chthoniobacterales bacterium]|nr:hypothetical protein [Chthoniobacterales bacterium]